MNQLAQHAEDRAKVEEEINAQERLAGDYARRQDIFNHLNQQIARHIVHITAILHRSNLDALTPEDIKSMHTICQSLGVRAVVQPGENGWPDVEIAYNLGMATGEPWFPPESGHDPNGPDDPQRRSVMFPLRNT